MHFGSLFLSSSLAASVVLAGHLGELRRSPLDLIEKRDINPSNLNTAGAILKSSEGFNFVSAIIKVPEIAPIPAHHTARGDIVVAIDHESDCGPTFVVGFGFEPIGDTYTVYSAWAQWSFGSVQSFDDAPISAGDDVRLTLMMDSYNSTGSGEAIFENLTQKTHSSLHIQSNYPLCLQTAGWNIIADLSNAELPNFGTITFKNATTIWGEGDRRGPPGSIIYDIIQNKRYLTSVQSGYDSVTVEYTGP